ncbi:hypothetical protein P261_02914 [Lachnospiraceae bacterium TWA4]|nr:hypothetical protein P261_02914 [Lachnospiraceae bacterium TWA4]
MRGDIYEKIISVITIIIVLMFVMNSNCYAAENSESILNLEVQEINGISAYENNTDITSVYDKDKNKYYIYCQSDRRGKNIDCRTKFEISYYNKGTKEEKKKVDNYKKTLSAKASVSLKGGGSNSAGTSVTRTGQTSTYKVAKEYLYTVTYITTRHLFSCNGAKYSALTFM